MLMSAAQSRAFDMLAKLIAHGAIVDGTNEVHFHKLRLAVHQIRLYSTCLNTFACSVYTLCFTTFGNARICVVRSDSFDIGGQIS